MKTPNPLNPIGKALYKRLYDPGMEQSILISYCVAYQNLQRVQSIINATDPINLPQKICTQWKTYASALNQLSVKLGLDQQFADTEQGEHTAIAKIVGGQ